MAQGPSKLALALIAALAAALTGAAPAGADFSRSIRTTMLLSRAHDGGFPDGPSRNAFVSADQRIARVVAYESDATNIITDDSNGLTDVFVAKRAQPWKKSGSLWLYGGTDLVSRGRGGQPANGRSYRPVTDGDSQHKASCVAFVSEASNLVPGDTNGVADAFVYRLGSSQIDRVSVDSRGRQADGPTYDVSVDGECARVAFTADAPNLALREPRDGWKSAITNRPRRGKQQVYVRFLKGEGNYRRFKGITFLASASDTGRAGNRASYDVQMARKGTTLAFTSEATNVAGRDSSRRADVYVRTIDRFIPRRSETHSHELLLRTRLVSATRSGRAGNGASSHPAINTDGRYVAYETEATNLASDSNGPMSDIIRADLGREAQGRGPPKQHLVSRSDFGQANGPSHRPSISAVGWFVVFDSEATNLRPSSHGSDLNGERDVQMWYDRSNRASIESRDSDNRALRAPSQQPSIGLHGNYVAFESVDPLIDVPLLQTFKPALAELVEKVDDITAARNPSGVQLDYSFVPNLLDADAAAPDPSQAVVGKPAADPAFHQIYLRYIGPCARTVIEAGHVRCLLR